MTNKNNELTITRNETFKITKLVQTADGKPFVISSKYDNPYWLIGVASSDYKQEGRYLLNIWLTLANYPRFNITQPISLNDFYEDTSYQVKKYPNGFSDITHIVSLDEVDYVVYGITKENANEVYYEASDAVFSYTDSKGNITYKYAKVAINGDISWIDYSCVIDCTFTQDVTKNWRGQNYVYSIKLVAGTLMLDYLRELCIDNNIVYAQDDTQEELYNKLVEAGYTFLDNFDYNWEIGVFSLVQPILANTAITVKSNLQGEM